MATSKIKGTNCVSVTANGSKTYTELLNELFLSVDMSKISINSCLRYKTSSYEVYAPCSFKNQTGTQLRFIGTYYNDSGSFGGYAFIVKGSGSKMYSLGSNLSSPTDVSSEHANNGQELAIMY